MGQLPFLYYHLTCSHLTMSGDPLEQVPSLTVLSQYVYPLEYKGVPLQLLMIKLVQLIKELKESEGR